MTGSGGRVLRLEYFHGMGVYGKRRGVVMGRKEVGVCVNGGGVFTCVKRTSGREGWLCVCRSQQEY